MSSFSQKGILAESEQLVMLAIGQLGERAYPVAIRQEVATRTGITMRRGGIYETLERLERRGFVTALTGAPTAERGDRITRIFRVTREGHKAMAHTDRIFSAWREQIKQRSS
jgi:PadR family transcriptional regulator PadR